MGFGDLDRIDNVNYLRKFVAEVMQITDLESDAQQPCYVAAELWAMTPGTWLNIKRPRTAASVR